MKDANGEQSCPKCMCNNRTVRCPSFAPSRRTPRGSAVPKKRRAAFASPPSAPREGDGRGNGPMAAHTAIIYQFRILMSERLIQKASTLRKPKRSSLLSLPEGRLGLPSCFCLLSRSLSDTLCYSRMISVTRLYPVNCSSIRSLVSLFVLLSSSCFRPFTTALSLQPRAHSFFHFLHLLFLQMPPFPGKSALSVLFNTFLLHASLSLRLYFFTVLTEVFRVRPISVRTSFFRFFFFQNVDICSRNLKVLYYILCTYICSRNF